MADEHDFTMIELQIIFGLLEQPHRLAGLKGISSKYFYSKIARAVFNKIRNYHRRTGKHMDLESFETYLGTIKKPKTREKLTIFFTELAKIDELSSNQFEFLLDALKREYKRRLINKKLYEVVMANEEDKDPDKAERLMTEGLMDIRGQSPQEDQLIDTDDDFVNSIDEYEDLLKQHKKHIPTGIQLWDNLTGGLYPSNLWLLGAFTSEGKTTTMINVARNAVAEGHNVLFVTLEETKDQVKRRLQCCHSNYIRQRTIGVNYSRLSKGELMPKEYKRYKRTIRSWMDMKRGKFIIWQAPANTTVWSIRDMLNYCHYSINIDAVFIDYLQLVAPKKVTGNKRYEQSGLLEDTKELALSFNEGKGIPILSAWQISRDGKRRARDRGGFYLMDDFSETSIAERTADAMPWLFVGEAHRPSGLVNIGLAKNRGGDICLKGRFTQQRFSTNLVGPDILKDEEVNAKLGVDKELKKADADSLEKDIEKQLFEDDDSFASED